VNTVTLQDIVQCHIKLHSKYAYGVKKNTTIIIDFVGKHAICKGLFTIFQSAMCIVQSETNSLLKSGSKLLLVS